MNTAITEVPAGYMLNAAGHLVPEDQVRDQDKLRNDVTLDLVFRAERINAELRAFKKRALDDIDDPCEEFALAQRVLDRMRVRPQALVHHADDIHEVSADSVHLVDECDAGNRVAVGLAPNRL